MKKRMKTRMMTRNKAATKKRMSAWTSHRSSRDESQKSPKGEERKSTSTINSRYAKQKGGKKTTSNTGSTNQTA